MPTIAEISNYGPNQPIVGLQATVKSCYPPKPFGQQGGTFQNAVIGDASGEVNAQFIDVEVYQGQPFMATSQQTTKKELGQERVTWDGAAYTEIYKDKFRFTIKKKGFTALAGGPAAPPPQPAYQPAPGAPVGQAWPGGMAPAPAMAPGWPYAAQQPPAYTQAAPQPAVPLGGQPGALPAVGSAQRPDPAWLSGQAMETGPSTPAQTFPPTQPAAPAKAPWQPAPKMGEAECRELLEKNFLIFSEHLCLEFNARGLSELPAEVVAGAMSWSTHLAIAIQRGDVIREPTAAKEPEPWTADGPAVGQYDNATLPAEGPDENVAFGG